MMEPAVHKYRRSWFRPSVMLGFLFFGAPSIYLWLGAWTYFYEPYLLFGIVPPPLSFGKGEWLVGLGIVSAICGWTASSYVTVRNSIKQHTINTLLQSRLSSQYATYASVVNRAYFRPEMKDEGPIPLHVLLSINNKEKFEAVNYILNYFEFLAVAIRHGDLDDVMMRQMMKSIIFRMCAKSSEFIAHSRGEVDGIPNMTTTQFEHITWLLAWWKLDHRSPWKRFTDWFDSLFVALEAKP